MKKKVIFFGMSALLMTMVLGVCRALPSSNGKKCEKHSF